MQPSVNTSVVNGATSQSKAEQLHGGARAQARCQRRSNSNDVVAASYVCHSKVILQEMMMIIKNFVATLSTKTKGC